MFPTNGSFNFDSLFVSNLDAVTEFNFSLEVMCDIAFVEN